MPWQHATRCVEGLRQRVRWYDAGLPIVVGLIALETAAVAYAFVRLGSCP